MSINRKHTVIGTGLIVTGLLALGGCAPAAPEAGADPTDATLSIATTSDVVNYNPLIGTSLSDYWITNLMYPRVLTMSPDGAKVPSVASDFGYTDATHGFYDVRDDMTWSDGEKLTAKDIAFTLNSVKEDKPAGILYGQMTNFLSAEAVSDTRVEVTLSQPDATALAGIGFWCNIVPEHIFGKADSVATFANDKDWVSAGPYTLDKVVSGQSYTLSRVEDYPLVDGGTPKSAEVVYRVYPDVNTEILALRNGDVDIIANPIPPAQVETLQKTDGVKVQEIPGLGFTTMKYNMQNENLANLKIRQALAHAVDYDAIRTVVLQDQAVSTGSSPIIPALKDFYDDSLKEYEFDPKLSRSLLADAGLTPDASGNFPVSFRMIYSLQDPVISQWASLVKDSAAEAGITIELQGLERNTYLAQAVAGDYDIYAGSFAITDDPSTTLALNYLPGGANNYSKTDDAALTDLIGQVRVSTELKEQTKLAREAAKIVHDNVYDNPIYQQNLYVAYREGVSGFIVLPSALQSIINPLSVASITKAE